MKKSALLLLFFTANFLYARAPAFLIESSGDNVSVSMGNPKQNKKNEVDTLKIKVKALEDEVFFLKNAVRELQQTVFSAYHHPHHPPAPPAPTSNIQLKSEKTIWSCYLQDPFGKTFSGKGSTEMEASGIALKACGGGIHCKKSALKCSSETQSNETIVSPSGGYIIETQKKKTWSCLLQDSFHRTFTGKGETEAEARAKALKACGGGMHCKDESMSCSHN